MPAQIPFTLLLTRPESDSRRFAAMLPEFPQMISPILRIEPVEHDRAALAQAESLVFTSAHAIPFAGPGQGRVALCVGERTAELALLAGFKVQMGNGFAEGLLPLIEATPTPLIHPHGRHIARNLPVPGMVVYEQISQPLLDKALHLLAGEEPVILPVFSPRSAQLLSAELQGATAPLWLVVISKAVAESFHAPFTKIAIAQKPTSQAMIKEIRDISRSEQS